ncbi:MAG: hypothetical protein MJ252_08475, partial [archaeon]|nr:hypothetical protein [archaeon]
FDDIPQKAFSQEVIDMYESCRLLFTKIAEIIYKQNLDAEPFLLREDIFLFFTMQAFSEPKKVDYKQNSNKNGLTYITANGEFEYIITIYLDAIVVDYSNFNLPQFAVYSFYVNAEEGEKPMIGDFTISLYLMGNNIEPDLLTKAQNYLSYGIDILDSESEAFNDECFLFTDGKWDYPQSYMINKVYSKYQLEVAIEDTHCAKNAKPDYFSGKVPIKCTNAPDYILVQPIDTLYAKKLADKDLKNPVFKCRSKMDGISKNRAFYVYLVVFVLFIILIIIFSIYRCSDSYSIRKAIFYDLWKTKRNKKSKEENKVKVATEEEIEEKETAEGTKSKRNKKLNEESKDKTTTEGEIEEKETTEGTLTCCKALGINWMRLHPLFSFPNTSIISPAHFTTMILFTNICGLFGFNAVLFSQSMLEERVGEEHTNTFYYPMIHEFGRIAASIFCCSAINFVIRLLNLIPLSTIQQLEMENNSIKDEDDSTPLYDSSHKWIIPRRIILILIMLGFNIFMFYYSVVFCGLYTHTQNAWLFSGIWSIIWDWVIFAPIYIIILSICDASLISKEVMFYIKLLFIF